MAAAAITAGAPAGSVETARGVLDAGPGFIVARGAAETQNVFLGRSCRGI
jgi:hypothetical protein